MFNFFKSKNKRNIKLETPKKTSIWEFLDKIKIPNHRKVYDTAFYTSVRVKPKVSGIAMDDSCTANTYTASSIEYGLNTVQFDYFASQAFIGFETMAILAQNKYIAKACNITAKDAIRKGWQVSCIDNDIDNKIFDKINYLDKIKYDIRSKLIDQAQFTKVFGIRVALFVVDSENPTQYYENPFNIDGVKSGSYKGIKQIDPYWCTPDTTLDNIIDPAALDFYEPTYWVINGQRYHKSHLIITRGEKVADILKPTYQYAGISLTQKIYYAIYCAEQAALEVPKLIKSKRLNVFKMDDMAAKVSNYTKFSETMDTWSQIRDNYGIKIADSEDSIEQLETSLGDLDVNVMTQFQLVCSIANIPSYKLLNAPMKGFSSGATEESSYHEELENIQDYIMTPLLDKHYQLLAKSELNEDFNCIIKWNELDSIGEKERAEINEIKSRTDISYINAGVMSQETIMDKLIKDEESPYYGAELLQDDYEDFGLEDNLTNEKENSTI